jgi:hypothetical protein
MQVFGHHLYEYCKGLRSLVLHTLSSDDVEAALGRLDQAGISYVIYPLGEKRVNLFFGAEECVRVVHRINKPNLKEYTPEEDFILGVMLGYERRKQCGRYLKRKVQEKPVQLCQCASRGCSHHHD